MRRGLQNECWPISDTLSSFPINGFAKAVWHLQTATFGENVPILRLSWVMYRPHKRQYLMENAI